MPSEVSSMCEILSFDINELKKMTNPEQINLFLMKHKDFFNHLSGILLK